MGRKTVKELEKKLKEAKSQFWKERRERENAQEVLKKRNEDVKRLQKEIKSTKGALANRNKRISELSSYAELETLKGQLEALMEWKDYISVGGVSFRFWIDADGAKLRTNGEARSSLWWKGIPEKATKLKAIAEEALKNGEELAELQSKLKAVGETVKSLYSLLPMEEPEKAEEPKEEAE